MTTNRPRAELFLNDAWVDVTSRLRSRSPVTVRRGRDDELAQATPSQIGMVLENVDGALTPRNPSSLWYPEWKRGTRCRVWVDGGTPALIVPGVDGSNASTPDTAALDITGTITVVARVDPEAWVPGALTYSNGSVAGGENQFLVSKWADPSNISWILYLTGPGWLAWSWSSTGTASTGARVSFKVLAELKPLWVGVTFRPNNGAGGNTIVWWTSDDGVTFTELDSETQSGTTSIFSGSAPVEIGTRNGNVASYRGRVLGARVISGEVAGSVVANPDFTAQTPGARSFTDSAGRVWSVNGTAEIATRTIRGVGQVDEIQTDWPHATRRDDPKHEGVSHVQVTASGMLRRMTQGVKPLASTLYRKITSPSVADNVVAYWPMEDGPDASQASSPMRRVQVMNTGGGTMRFGADSSLPSSAPLPSVSAGELIAYAAPVPRYSSTQTRVDFFARIDTPNASPGTIIMAVESNGSAAQWRLGIDATNVTILILDPLGATIDTQTIGSDSRMFGTWCLWSLNIEQNGGNVDWSYSVVPIPLGLNFSDSGSFAGTVGEATVIHNWLTAAPAADGISFGHLVVSTGLDLGWLAGADTAWVGETAAHRFWRLCTEENIPVHIIGDNTVWESLRGDQLLSAPMGLQGQRTLVDLLAECAQVDGGIMSEHRTAPALNYRTRQSLYNQTAAVTLDTNLDGIRDDFAPLDDDQRLRNDVTATRPDGSSARVTTTPEPDPGELYDVDITVNVESDLQLPDQAGWRLHLGTWPAMRYPGLSTSLRTAGVGVATRWADIALGDLVTLDNLPRQHEKTTDMLLEGYTETLSFFDWTAALNCSPAGPWTVGIREDDVLGIRDTGGSELDEAFVAGTGTTMQVATTAGPIWAETAAANSALPFDVDVGGFQMTVTDIDNPGPIAFGSTGTVAHAVNASVTPSLPASTAAGDLLLAWVAIRNANAGSVSGGGTGWVELVDAGNASLWGRIAEAGEVAPTFTFSGGVANADTSAQIVRFTGPFHDVGRVLVAATDVLNASAQDINYEGIHVPEPNCLILYLGWKQDDWTSVAAIAGATEIGEPDTTTGDDQGIVWDYLIQTTAADIAAGSFVVTGGAAAISVGAVVVIRSDVQTFTVTQTPVNLPTATKTIPSGTAVSLWQPARRAL